MGGTSNSHVKIPTALIIGVALYCLSTIGLAIGWGTSVSTRIAVAEKRQDLTEKRIENVPERLAALEANMSQILGVLKEIRDNVSTINRGR